MLHEIHPHRLNNKYLSNKNIEEKDFVLHYKENTLLLKICGNALEIPRKSDFPEISDRTTNTFLFTLDEVPCFLITDDLKADESRFTYKDTGFFRKTRQYEIAWVSMVGFNLMNWYVHNKYCGKCGLETQQKPDERALICPKCNTIVFPKISPAVIAAIICNDKILLARGLHYAGNWYSLIAGYVDVGESLEDAIKREVKEEVGLEIKNIRYYKSQPWPLSGSMMVGFIAEADDNQPISIDEKEIAEAAWFTRGNLPAYSLNISIAGEMIEKFENNEL